MLDLLYLWKITISLEVHDAKDLFHHLRAMFSAGRTAISGESVGTTKLGLKSSIRANCRMKIFLIMAGALILLLTVFIARARKRQKARREVCQAVFDAAYAKSEDTPSLQMSYGYGVPIFKVTHPSRAAYERSELSGANSNFRRGVQAACEECGTQANPYDASRAIHFAWLAVENEVFFPSATSRDDTR